jgi:hypothetical protein
MELLTGNRKRGGWIRETKKLALIYEIKSVPV